MPPKNTTVLLQKLRKLMKTGKSSGTISEIGEFHAYIIPSCDAHQSEYIADCDMRRSFISGFDGSAGTAIVTSTVALLWTDGRYFLQASAEMDENWILMKQGLPETPTESAWLTKNLPTGSRVGIDPFLMSHDSWKRLNESLSTAGMTLVPMKENLIDQIWQDRPAFPANPVKPHLLKYSGKLWSEKVADIRSEMKKKDASILVVSDLAEIAWLLNLRGSDIVYNPVFFAYVIITMNNVHLFIDQSKLSSDVKDHLRVDQENLIVHPYSDVLPRLESLIVENSGKIWIDSQSSHALFSNVPAVRLITNLSPIQIMKAVKNSAEVEGMRKCQVQDSIAVCEYFCWLEKHVPAGGITELSGSDKINQFRSEKEDFVGLSFSAISCSGPNGAIMHYKPSKETDSPITCDAIYLCDSGGQYNNGTTDVTRTFHFGTPSDYEKECFTRVLKGHISLCTAVFPRKVIGNKLDVLARTALWDVGLDYLHGTGHGVGSYLNVHEGPMGMNYKPLPTDPGILENMIMTIEPGYYENGKFGIRIENVVLVKKTDTKFKVSDYLTFEALTLVPIQLKFIKPELLSENELEWLNHYHQTCRDVLGPELKRQGKQDVYEWLQKETAAI